MFQKTMLASAKSKAHEAFKNGNYLVAAKIYGEVYFCILLVIVYGLIDCLGQVERLVHFSFVFLFPAWNGMCDENYADVLML